MASVKQVLLVLRLGAKKGKPQSHGNLKVPVHRVGMRNRYMTRSLRKTYYGLTKGKKPFVGQTIYFASPKAEGLTTDLVFIQYCIAKALEFQCNN